MKTLLYLLLFMNSLICFSQQNAIEITNIKTGKTHFFSENQRVKIRTLDRKKHVGRIYFSNQNTLLIGHESIPIDSIFSIKRQSIFLGTLKSGLFLAGITVAGASIIKASSGDNSAVSLFLVGAGATIGSGLIEGLNVKYTNKKCTFKIVQL